MTSIANNEYNIGSGFVAECIIIMRYNDTINIKSIFSGYTK